MAMAMSALVLRSQTSHGIVGGRYWTWNLLDCSNVNHRMEMPCGDSGRSRGDQMFLGLREFV